MKLIVSLLVVLVACVQTRAEVIVHTLSLNQPRPNAEPATPLIVDPPQPTPTPQEAHHRLPLSIPVNPETENSGFSANGEKLWEGDMILNKEQLERLTSPLDTRKAKDDEMYRWTNGRVPYVISQSSQNDRAAILAGLKHWTDNSCIRFVEVAAGAQEPHLIFKKLGGCYSSVGMQYFLNGQDLSIGKNCEGLGTVAHEVGHALGFYHEQSRPDRDRYVKLLEHNMNQTMKYNFDLKDDINTYGVPYDLGSLLHYGLDYFTVNGKNTMVPMDVHKTFLIGQRVKLSFYDLKMANAMYNCSARCANPPSCSNGGYVDHNCRCKCPDEFTGQRCESRVPVAGGAPCGGTFYNPTTIKTLNYPDKYPAENCIWLLKAPAGKKVRVTFSSFDVMYREESKGQCLWDFLEIRSANRYEGEKYCGEELKYNAITAPGNEMSLLFRAKYDWNTGFEAKVTFV